jgi:hypothetical protein
MRPTEHITYRELQIEVTLHLQIHCFTVRAIANLKQTQMYVDAAQYD